MHGSIRRLALLAGATLFSLSACGSAASPSSAPPSAMSAVSAEESPSPAVSAAPSATPLPTPTPIDAAQAFIDKINSPTFAGRSVISGQVTVAGQTFAITGSLDVSGSDSHALIAVAAPGQVPHETATVGGVSYTKAASGAWFPAPVQSGAKMLGDSFRSPGSVTDLGVEVRDGRSLHHLKPVADPIDLADFGVTGPSGSTPSGTTDFYVADDGSPVDIVLSAAWTQKAGSTGVPAAMTLEFAFSCTGCVVTIAPPSPIFETFTSKLYHYSLAVPEDWDAVFATSTKKPDMYESPDPTYLAGARFPAAGMTLNELVRTAIDCNKTTSCSGWKAYKQESNDAARLGGVTARRLAFHATYKGTRTYSIMFVVVRKGYATIIELTDEAGHEAADRLLMDQIVQTFAFR